MDTTTTIAPGPIDCACVIHGNAYSWDYVEKLYNMLNRHITPGIRLHVYTEADRPVPKPMIKHPLTNWGIAGPKTSWWYKIQLFNSEHHAGPLLYFDLDTVIVNNIDWIWQQPLRYFWAIRDFKYLWDAKSTDLNSSVMWWDTRSYDSVWQNFQTEDLSKIMRQYRGDQNYITARVRSVEQRFFDPTRIKSWRWQCLDGGYNFQTRKYLHPNTGTHFPTDTSILVFHGKPKPVDLTDPLILQHWK
jgi:hypothetical protein